MPNALSNMLSGILGGTHGVQFSFETKAPKQPEFRVRKMSLVEAVSDVYVLEAELGTDEPMDSLGAMLGKGATLGFIRDGERRVHGIVEHVREGASTPETTVIHVRIVPALRALKLRTSSRIFEGLSVPDVVEQVLKEGLTAFQREVKLKLKRPADYPKRELIVQHRETDYGFVTRLLAEQGLWFYFEHPLKKGASEVLHITDDADFAPPVDEDAEVLFVPEGVQGATQEAVKTFAHRETMQTNGVQLRQFDWTHPDLLRESEQSTEEPAGFLLSSYEHGDVGFYDYREPKYHGDEAERQGRIRLELAQVQRFQCSGSSDVTVLRPGHYFRLEGKEYLVLRVSHHGGTVVNTGQSSLRGDYGNIFECIPRAKPFRPDRVGKARLVGWQTALVVDPSGKVTAPTSSSDGPDIATDVHGRIRVKFHWDLTQAGPGGTNSCWVRVAQSWAGAGFGTQFIPRVGMEVVVQFEDGDPDRPMVTGAVYNGLNTPPYSQKPTQSGIKTASSVDPTRYNELRFEDAKDNEQIFVRAQKDYVEEVLNDHKTTVHAAQTQLVKKSQSETVHGNQTLSVGGKRVKTVGGDKEHGEEITIKGERKTTVTKKHTEIFEDEHEVTVTKAVKETYQDTHDRAVTGVQKLKVEADKLEHVVGRYELSTESAYVLNQGGTKLTFEGDSVALDAASNISVKQGGSSLDIDTGGNIALKSTGSITLEVGPNKLVISASGIELNGTQIALTAGPSELALTAASANLKSVNTAVEATAMCTIKGTTMLGLN